MTKIRLKILLKKPYPGPSLPYKHFKQVLRARHPGGALEGPRASGPQSPKAPEPRSPGAPKPQGPGVLEPRGPSAPEPQGIGAPEPWGPNDPGGPKGALGGHPTLPHSLPSFMF